MKPEPADTIQRNHVAPVAGFLEVADPAGTADSEQLPVFLDGLHHANQPTAGTECILDHRKITRLKNIQRQLAARKQQRVRQRENRNLRRQGRSGIKICVHRPNLTRGQYPQENKRVESLRRAAITSGFAAPSVAKNSRSCSRAASSFQPRSMRMDSRSWAIASALAPIA